MEDLVGGRALQSSFTEAKIFSSSAEFSWPRVSLSKPKHKATIKMRAISKMRISTLDDLISNPDDDDDVLTFTR